MWIKCSNDVYSNINTINEDVFSAWCYCSANHHKDTKISYVGRLEKGLCNLNIIDTIDWHICFLHTEHSIKQFSCNWSDVTIYSTPYEFQNIKKEMPDYVAYCKSSVWLH